MLFKVAALVLLSASVLAAKEPQQSKPVAVQPVAASSKTPIKVQHGKREASVGFGPMEYIAPSHPGYNYGIAQPSFNLPSYPSQKYIMAPFKYAAPQPSYFAPAGHHSNGYNSFADNSIKYSIGTKELAELLKALHSPNPAFAIKAVPTGHGLDTPYSFDPVPQYKPAMIKIHEIPAHTYGTPLGSPLGSYYAAPQHAAYHEPSYASGIKGLRHFASHSSNAPVPDLYSGNKYISAIKPITVQTPAQVLSPLHTSVQTQKPFKPSTYLGSTNDLSEYSHTQAPTSTTFHSSYLAPSLQYLPPKAQNKVTYEQPAKTYLPSVHSKPNNAYLPPKPSNTYLPASTSSASYIPLTSHEDSDKYLQHLHHHHTSEESNESYDYSASASAPAAASTAKPSSHHPWQP